jgi:hypothetical protein
MTASLALYDPNATSADGTLRRLLRRGRMSVIGRGADIATRPVNSGNLRSGTVLRRAPFGSVGDFPTVCALPTKRPTTAIPSPPFVRDGASEGRPPLGQLLLVRQPKTSSAELETRSAEMKKSLTRMNVSDR